MIDTVLHGDALEELRKLPDNSIDALVCDPPSSINFMGKSWDSDKGGRKQWIAWLCSIMQEVHRVLKPGAHGLVWSLPRTSHWTGTALEDAGFEIRDSIYHVFGSGFPKSLDVSKAIDKLYGAEREIIGVNYDFLRRNPHTAPIDTTYNKGHKDGIEAAQITAPATPEAASWAGWGSALKPSVEQWWLIRKPLSETSIAKNVMTHGTGAINIDACRITTDEYTGRPSGQSVNAYEWSNRPNPMKGQITGGNTQGRFPSHLLLSHSLFCDEQCVPECPVAIMDAQSGYSKGNASGYNWDKSSTHDNPTPILGNSYIKSGVHYADQGGASRYFAQFRPDAPFIYASKASRKDRTSDGNVNNTHPTCKSQSLMRYMLKLVVPPNGVVLDCFAGSGSTLISAISEGFHYIGIEQELEYINIIHARIAHAIKNTPNPGGDADKVWQDDNTSC